MYPELGQIALILALLLAVLLSVVPLVGSVTGRDQLLAFARPLSAGLFVFVAMAWVVKQVDVLPQRVGRQGHGHRHPDKEKKDNGKPFFSDRVHV